MYVCIVWMTTTATTLCSCRLFWVPADPAAATDDDDGDDAGSEGDDDDDDDDD
jgi:hypothetical protein